MNGVLFPIGPCVLVLVVIAAAWDWQTRRIPNWLVASALVFALPMQLTLHGVPGGMQMFFGGCVTGGALLLPGYLLRVVGAGDVKLMVAVGALCGAAYAVEVGVFASVIVGLWALASLLYRRRFREGMSTTYSLLLSMAGGVRQTTQDGQALHAPSLGKMPFGVAIAIGTVCALTVSL
jgi:prepilin peptidase CpaA